MRILDQVRTGIKAAAQLEIRQLCYWLLYRAGLQTGYFRLITPADKKGRLPASAHLFANWFYTPPPRDAFFSLSPEITTRTKAIADEVTNGNVRLFGGQPQPLILNPGLKTEHWTTYEKLLECLDEDIKLTWEPARFNWAIWLAKAYFFSGDEKYAACFWENWEKFSRSNPVNTGPNWQSGQEIALRLIAIIVSLHFFKSSEVFTPERTRSLLENIAFHAERIPATVAYAKAQNNNHLISEAVGLYCAGVFLHKHPKAGRWKRSGLKWFNQAILSQIDDSGEYIQHSANYHRMMLTAALWMHTAMTAAGDTFHERIRDQLARAVVWLRDLADAPTGRAPNIGHNDGSFILPFTICTFYDYRPVIQAASHAFLHKSSQTPGIWNDYSVWLGLDKQDLPERVVPELSPHSIHRLGEPGSWASLRAARFRSRPAHADQLHVEVWHKGVNLARDAGTYLYNAPPPWRNGLAGTRVHNTITINDRDQMLAAGRFLWLDWAQASLTEKNKSRIKAFHDGYRKMGVIHERGLEKTGDGIWLISDQIKPVRAQGLLVKNIHLHWLTGDWPYEARDGILVFDAPCGKFSLEISTDPQGQNAAMEIIRAGESAHGLPADPTLGWYSPTYNFKEPALSVVYSIRDGKIPLLIYTKITIHPQIR